MVFDQSARDFYRDYVIIMNIQEPLIHYRIPCHLWKFEFYVLLQYIFLICRTKHSNNGGQKWQGILQVSLK